MESSGVCVVSPWCVPLVSVPQATHLHKDDGYNDHAWIMDGMGWIMVQCRGQYSRGVPYAEEVRKKGGKLERWKDGNGE